MKSCNVALCFSSFLLFLSACGDSAQPLNQTENTINVAALEDLLNCTEAREGESALVAEDSSTYRCENGKWEFVSAPTPTVESLDDLLNCSAKMKGDTVKVRLESAIYRCNNGKWEKYRVLTDTLNSVEDMLACITRREGNTSYIAQERALYRCASGVWEKVGTFMDSTSSRASLLNCTGKKEGDSTYVIDESSVYLCIDNAWRFLGLVLPNSNDLPNCTESREGGRALIADERVTLTCSAGKWYRYDIYKDVQNSGDANSTNANNWEDFVPQSSTSQQPASSSQSFNPSRSSASVTQSSTSVPPSSASVVPSSTSTTPSSASEVVTSPYPSVSVSAVSAIDCSNAMYCPKDCRHTSNTTTCGKVYTGLDDGTGTQGYLWTYTDSDIGGTSEFYWPEGGGAKQFEVYSRDNLGYLKGTANFGSGFDYPFARMGFWIKGENKSANITAWAGMCLIYSATQDFYIIIRFAGDDEATASDLIQAKIPKRTSKSLANVSWSDFVQEGWGTAVNKSTAISNAERIEFSFKGDAGASNDFSIYAIGKYGTCD